MYVACMHLDRLRHADLHISKDMVCVLEFMLERCYSYSSLVYMKVRIPPDSSGSQILLSSHVSVLQDNAFRSAM